MGKSIWSAGVATVVFSLGLIGCTRPAQLRVPLDYRATERPSVGTFTAPSGLKLAVTVEDARGGATEIGRNSEDTPPVPIYPAGPAVDAFVRDAVARQLTDLGITVEPERAKAGKVLALRVRRLWVEETNTYKAEITADVVLTDAARRLWQGQLTGTNERFGRSLQPENYQETLSDSIVDLVQTPAFVAALNAPAARPHGGKAKH
jgi:hypothetical protein